MRLNPGDKAVPFSAETIEGKTISLESFAGKPLLRKRDNCEIRKIERN